MTRVKRALVFALVAAAWPVAAGAQDAARGEALFMRLCKGCHRLTDSVMVGPGLAGVTARRGDEWLRRWLEDPPAMRSTDPDAQTLSKPFRSHMRKIKDMESTQNREDIIAYLKNASGGLNK